ncbi:hypothetical protein Q9295_16375 [Xinfangfangia sp. CPCC 101601]|uniref:Ethanolamine utilization protein EutQ n=1 Tax=Pseudogemmobacter lacusdianii TaxID=3069608 RepID=A0ABU0W1Q3_9RHOB|nr:hypothetical protein [Xinfangfangia sp. CPCC 101601]MDQ2067951.1 hypothetical protein [Xinfangfangia sp. CPCC 101601]
MTDTTPTLSPSLYKLADLDAKPFSPRGCSPNELFNDLTGASMSGGVVYFRDSELPFTVWYDEILFCHACEDLFEVVVGDVTHRLEPGDTIWLPAGTELIYRSKGLATAFFAITPAGWASNPPA